MSGKEQEFVPVGGRRDRKKKQPQQEKQPKSKPQPKPKEEKPKAPEPEKPAEEPKSAINENTIFCMYCYNLGHKSDACPEKKHAKEYVKYCIACGKPGHNSSECHVSSVNDCFFCGNQKHTYKQCPEREKIVFERDGKKMESTLICRNCGAVGHSSRECKEPSQRRQVCMRCGAVGHITSGCPQPAEDSSLFIVCLHCGEIGHKAADCKVPSIVRPNVCPLCGQIGHTKEECTADMPKTEEAVKEPVKEDSRRKKAITASDLKDTEQFPSLSGEQ